MMRGGGQNDEGGVQNDEGGYRMMRGQKIQNEKRSRKQ